MYPWRAFSGHLKMHMIVLFYFMQFYELKKGENIQSQMIYKDHLSISCSCVPCISLNKRLNGKHRSLKLSCLFWSQNWLVLRSNVIKQISIYATCLLTHLELILSLAAKAWYEPETKTFPNYMSRCIQTFLIN